MLIIAASQELPSGRLLFVLLLIIQRAHPAFAKHRGW